jgi:3-dehydroquinate dehydratase-2
MLGIRRPEIYGIETLETINNGIVEQFPELDLEFFQSNHEGEIIDKLNFAHKAFNGVVINPGALAHYSYALCDAIEACILPVVEVHLSNIYAREEFRQKSVISSACIGIISGFGKYSYVAGLEALVQRLKKKEK